VAGAIRIQVTKNSPGQPVALTGGFSRSCPGLITPVNYKTYLASHDWKRKKRRKYRYTRWCAICGRSGGLHVHHLFYRPRLQDAQQSDLRVLCGRCHKLAHELIASGAVRIKLSRVTDHEQSFKELKAGVCKSLGIDGLKSHNKRRKQAFEQAKIDADKAEIGHTQLDEEFYQFVQR